MKPGRLIATTLGACSAIFGSLGQSSAAPAVRHQALVGKAPYFSAATADGKAYDLKTLNTKGPVYIFFIKADCPITAEAMHFYTDMGKAYGAKAPLIGVFSGDADEFKAYNQEHKLTFPTVLDPKLDVIARYKVRMSPWIVEVKADGTVGHVWRGYSKDFLQQMNTGIAAAAGMPIAKIDLSDAPNDPTYG